MGTKMGITMIEMYCKMISERFAPIYQTLNVRNNQLLDKCKILAKKELGIYDKMVRLKKLELEIEELKEQIDIYTRTGYSNGRHRSSRIDQLANEKLKTVENGFRGKVEQTERDMIYKIKLSGLDDDTQAVFNDLPDVIKSLTKELKQLPPPAKKMKILKGAAG